MGKKLELVLFSIEIEKYISELTNENGEPAGSEEKRKTRAALAHFVKMLKDNGRTWPEITDFDTFKANSKATPNETNQNDRRIRKFFASLDTERKNDTMTENKVIDVEETIQPLDDGASTENTQASKEPEAEITAPIEPEETTENQPELSPEETKTPAPVRKKPGRKVFDTVNGSKKSEKLMMYFTPELIAKIRVWCDMKGISNVSYITGLVEADLDSKTDKINAFLKMRSEL